MSHTSPYARKVRVFGLELGLEAQLDEVPVTPTDDPEALVAVNPVSKIPALVTDDGMNIHDSRVISSSSAQDNSAYVSGSTRAGGSMS